ncbi:unnamed protein product [Moneuplotes crassus]|uniref:Exonuclease domain-containing protein n=1 Tax=Euplotes crassus TaxID=5936 RepID=A0AAD1XR70_EUPCR|nr:unnamed protein product [Moneuplotes crassus]
MEASQKIELKHPLVWIDLEMTGLILETNQIIEIAVIVTDADDLDTRYEGPNIVIGCPQEMLDNMDEWCTKTHGESGLTQRVIESKVTLEEAEEQVLDFLQNTCNIKPRTAPLAGNSISTDKMFLYKDMKKLYDFLHYRILDVSSFKQACAWWYPEDAMNVPPKKETHRALDDIVESIEEMKFYKSSMLK